MRKQFTSYLSLILLLLALPALSFAGFGDSGEEKPSTSQIKVDISMFDYTPKAAKKAALLAFLRRNWDIESIEPDRYVGVINSGSSITKAEIITKDNTLVIQSLKGFSVKSNWLENLKKDFLVFMVEESY